MWFWFLLLFIHPCNYCLYVKCHTILVSVAPPWDTNTYVPQGSSVHVNCTGEKNQHPAWTIILTGSQAVSLQFSFEQSVRLLNSRNFYKLLEVELEMATTIQLLINSTEGNNGTVIQCVDIGSATIISETTLTVYGEWIIFGFT